MLKKLYRIMLTVNSIILYAFIFLVKEKIQIPIGVLKSEYCSYIVYFVLAIIFSGLCLYLAKFFPREIIAGGIRQVESASGSYLPSYLGYFFVALSINNVETFVCVGIVIFLFR